MTSEGNPPANVGPGHPAYLDPAAPIDEGTWSHVHDGAHVASVSGEPLGRVRDKSSHVFIVEAPKNLLETQELYVPHTAVDRIKDGQVHLRCSREELVAADAHNRQHLTPPPPAG
ncbi:MAG: hypothetical protein ACRDJE_21085 [Dehalococcoidia bacterium]